MAITPNPSRNLTHRHKDRRKITTKPVSVFYSISDI